MNLLNTLLRALAMLSLAACAAPQSTPSDLPGDAAHSSRNSLDWGGIYKGILPCADCSGIETSLELNADQSYTLRTRYLGKEGSITESQGSFRWNEAGSTITLENEGDTQRPDQYFIAEGRIFQLDRQGERISGALADRYVLQKLDMNLLERYWRLTELRGQPLSPDQNQRKEPHLRLLLEGDRVQGHGGCNAFSGSYMLKPGNVISFSQLASTRMACPNMEVENQLHKILEAVDTYTISGEILELRQGSNPPLAKFVAAQGE